MCAELHVLRAKSLSFSIATVFSAVGTSCGTTEHFICKKRAILWSVTISALYFSANLFNKSKGKIERCIKYRHKSLQAWFCLINTYIIWIIGRTRFEIPPWGKNLCLKEGGARLCPKIRHLKYRQEGTWVPHLYQGLRAPIRLDIV